MKAAFFFDTFLLKDKNDFWGMTLTYEFLKERYLKYYDSLIISTRVKDLKNEKGNRDGYKKTNGTNIEVIPILNYKSIPDGILKKKKIKREIEAVLNKVDVAIIRMPSMIGNIACEICEKNNKKYKIEMVACAWDGYVNHHNKTGKIVAPYMYLEAKKHIKKAKEVLYVTNDFLQKRYPTKGQKTACSDVVLKEFDEGVLKKRMLKISNISNSGEIKLCTVANVGLKYKGQEFVIKAMSIMNNKNIKYYLIGNGDNSYLTNIIKKYNLDDRVIFLGSIPHEKIFSILEEMDIYIQPSLQEGMPRALLEAMSLGMPCYGSTAGGIPELLGKDYLFEKKDYKQIAFYLDNINSSSLKENALKSIEVSKQYNIKLLNKKREEFYSTIKE